MNPEILKELINTWRKEIKRSEEEPTDGNLTQRVNGFRDGRAQCAMELENLLTVFCK